MHVMLVNMTSRTSVAKCHACWKVCMWITCTKTAQGSNLIFEVNTGQTDE